MKSFAKLITPYVVWMFAMIIVPMLMIVLYAFTVQGNSVLTLQFTLSNFARFFSDPIFPAVLLRSLKMALFTTVFCIMIGYPIAYIIARAAPRAQKTMITLIMVPMWMNFLIRTYAWMTILQDTGLLNGLLQNLGLGTVHIIGTEAAVVIGMVYDYLPYMIMPIYSIMAKMDNKLLEAAKDLGCNNVAVLRRVIWPLSLPGVISGITMVLVPSISTFYISQKLGNGKFYLIGDAIEGQYVAGNLHFAAAIAFIMMIILLAGMALMRRLADRHMRGGM